jgi:PAS domain S-box-containing protein
MNESMDKTPEENELRFRSEYRDTPVGMAMVSLEGRFLAVNPAFCEFLGYSEEELLHKDIVSVTHSEDRSRTMDLLLHVVMHGKELPTHEKRYLRKDGQQRWGEVSATVVCGLQGQPAHYVARVLDITDRKRRRAGNS